MSKHHPQPQPSTTTAVCPEPPPATPHAVSGRYVKLARGGPNNAHVRAEVVTVRDGHVVMVEELHPLDAAPISVEYANRELWAGVSGRKQ